MRRITVAYRLGAYAGETTVLARNGEDLHEVFARARKQVDESATKLRIVSDEPQ